jgi:hypothetical protein
VRVPSSHRLQEAQSAEKVHNEAVTECPEGLRGKLPDPWDNRAEGLGVLIVSHGEEFALKAQLLDGKYTIIDKHRKKMAEEKR